jgi:hypothetical protein
LTFDCFTYLQEILKQIKVKNLDTGEEMDLVEAEDKLPPSINPLSLHIMRLTSEYVRCVSLVSVVKQTYQWLNVMHGEL